MAAPGLRLFKLKSGILSLLGRALQCLAREIGEGASIWLARILQCFISHLFLLVYIFSIFFLSIPAIISSTLASISGTTLNRHRNSIYPFSLLICPELF